MNDRAPAGFFDGVFDRDPDQSAQRVAGHRRFGARRPDRRAAARASRRRRGAAAPADAELSRRARRRGHGARPRGRARPHLSALNAGGPRAVSARCLADEFDVDRAAIDRCCAALAAAAEPAERAAAERALRAALEPPRVTLLRQFNALPEGVKFLVDRRAELLELGRRRSGCCAASKTICASCSPTGSTSAFSSCKRITWESPAALLEKLMAYEAVHEIRGWTDLKNRLEADRRCFAFFHPRMPDEPLIFVEVALVAGMAGNIHALLDEAAPIGDPQAADTAIFYSISNCQRGLAGISFGDFLIKRVVDALAAELPRLKVFATLSPAPGLSRLARPAKRDGARRPAAAGRAECDRGARRTGMTPNATLPAAARPRRLACRSAARRGAARAAAAALRALSAARARPLGPGARPGRPFPPQQRRAGRAAQLARRHVAKGPAAIRRDHGQLSLSARRYRSQPRGLSRRGAGRRRRARCAAWRDRLNPAARMARRRSS